MSSPTACPHSPTSLYLQPHKLSAFSWELMWAISTRGGNARYVHPRDARYILRTCCKLPVPPPHCHLHPARGQGSSQVKRLPLSRAQSQNSRLGLFLSAAVPAVNSCSAVATSVGWRWNLGWKWGSQSCAYPASSVPQTL